MGVNVTLVVPTVDPDLLAPFERLVTKRWGGLTSWQGIGSWTDGRNILISEPITVFACSVRGMVDDDAYQWWHTLAESVRETFEQDCVFLSFTPQDAELVGKRSTTRIGGNDENVQSTSN